MILQNKLPDRFDNIQGIIAQFQVMISVFMTISVIKWGYITSLFINMFEIGMVTSYVISSGDLYAFPGIIIPITTMFIISILSFIVKDKNSRINDVQIQNEEIFTFYEEVTASEAVMNQQEQNPEEDNATLINKKENVKQEENLKQEEIMMKEGLNGITKVEINRKKDFTKHLESAIEKNELYLVFQPQYFIKPKMFRGVEVLVRWRSPEFGIINPLQFIPVAEKTGYIITLGEWVLREACRMFKKIVDLYALNAVISVNISAKQIMEPGFKDVVKIILKETGLLPRYLELEITESAFISEIDYVINILTDLKSIGIHIALDDFGTGYSSLNYLQRLPIDTLKIDKSFIQSIGQIEHKKQLVGSIISLVHHMDV
jgi:EAL domain-containing protein (putative c-di-GMP-specific phosphodiesterase class I)